MRLLLDTAAYWWAATDPARLSAKARRALRDESNDLVVSVVSWWEMLIKRQRGNLDFPDPARFLPESARRLGASPVLPVMPAHVLELDHLPPHHRDPFDRLLICQARIERLTLVTGDDAIRAYEIDCLW